MVRIKHLRHNIFRISRFFMWTTFEKRSGISSDGASVSVTGFVMLKKKRVHPYYLRFLFWNVLFKLIFLITEKPNRDKNFILKMRIKYNTHDGVKKEKKSKGIFQNEYQCFFFFLSSWSHAYLGSFLVANNMTGPRVMIISLFRRYVIPSSSSVDSAVPAWAPRRAGC